MIIDGKDTDHAYAACVCGATYFVVDRWLYDCPPGPRGAHPDSWIEVYRDAAMDPDDRVRECLACGRDIERLIEELLDLSAPRGREVRALGSSDDASACAYAFAAATHPRYLSFEERVARYIWRVESGSDDAEWDRHLDHWRAWARTIMTTPDGWREDGY